jgi:hypothetical protein
MTEALRASILFKVLTLAPMGESEVRSRKLAAAGDVPSFWRYYERYLRDLSQLDDRIEHEGGTSFRMLRPAMAAVLNAKQPDTSRP